MVINGFLANYYGIEGVHGDAFRKVPLPAGSPRGGLLGMAAVHLMGGNGEHTSRWNAGPGCCGSCSMIHRLRHPRTCLL